MHDVESDPKQRMPPLVVLGLTGPVGSGCTTLSRVLDDPNAGETQRGEMLIRTLRAVGWVRSDGHAGAKIDWKKLNEAVDASYGELSQEEEETQDSPHPEASTKTVRQDKRHQILEFREAAKALDRLKLYHSARYHLFKSLSMSDLIVYRALMALEKRDFSLIGVADLDRRSKYGRFVKVARNHMHSLEAKQALERAGVEGYADFHRRCYAVLNKAELEQVGRALYDVHAIARQVKREYHKTYELDYSEVMQDFGDNLRRCGNPFGLWGEKLPDSSYRLAKGIAQIIHILYKTKQGAFFIIDCLRNPYEVMYLRREFANFFLLSLYATKKTRQERIINSVRQRCDGELDPGKEAEIIRAFNEADRRDSGSGLKNEETLYRQDVTKCVQMSDIAINNERQGSPEDHSVIEELLKKSFRILCLILSPGCTRPNRHEMFMNLAYTMALKSNCISRQVGAVIVGRDGYVIGAGWNAAGSGRVGCGLRAIRDLQLPQFQALARAIAADGENVQNLIRRLIQQIGRNADPELAPQLCFCLKDILAEKDMKPRLEKALGDLLRIDGSPDDSTPADHFRRFIKSLVDKAIELTPLHQLEYCLALHAEENAILQSAKIGGMGLRQSTMYVTCQPCSLCAKKIQQVGIAKVVYTEAYPKSMPDVYMSGIALKQFEGVKPRGYVRLFMPHHDQKEWQHLEQENLIPEI